MNQPASTTANTKEAGSTANILLDTAERLFASEGIENVSIRQIVIASGHGNLSGAHYHFGSREELIRKLLHRRMVTVDAIRHRALDSIIDEGRGGDLGAIVESTVRVLESVTRNYPWGRDYVLVAAQALFNPRIQLLATIDSQAVTGLTRTAEMLRPLLSHLSPEVFAERLRMVRYTAVFEFSRWFQENRLTDATRAAFDAMIVNLSAFLSAGLAAPATRPAAPQPRRKNSPAKKAPPTRRKLPAAR